MFGKAVRNYAVGFKDKKKSRRALLEAKDNVYLLQNKGGRERVLLFILTLKGFTMATLTLKCSSPKVRGKYFIVEVARKVPDTVQGFVDLLTEETAYKLITQAFKIEVMAVGRQTMNAKDVNKKFIYDAEEVARRLREWLPGTAKPSFASTSAADQKLAQARKEAADDPEALAVLERLGLA